jgi:hypothetical protein
MSCTPPASATFSTRRAENIDNCIGSAQLAHRGSNVSFGSPSDYRAISNTRADVRRMLRADGMLVDRAPPRPKPLDRVSRLEQRICGARARGRGVAQWSKQMNRARGRSIYDAASWQNSKHRHQQP